ncbi:MAG: polysaccharide deacetylase family protein [Acidobacteriaceae bacterium]|nr:polysaccharide deacetylase family protein [Acidobacteriaceae bacterium]
MASPDWAVRVVTTSWDDGDPNDRKLADLLSRYRLKGTFYVPVQPYHGKNRLQTSDLRALHTENFEIGAHSVSHKNLSDLGGEELIHEVRDCKQILEQLLGDQVPMFCYPNGRYDADAVEQVRRAGYSGARSTRMLSVARKFDAYRMPTSLQAYPHGKAAYLRNQGRAKNISGLAKYALQWQQCRRWIDLGKALFDRVWSKGGVWHLYGHSWEIEELGLWDELREMFEYVAGRESVAYVTNGQLLSMLGRS